MKRPLASALAFLIVALSPGAPAYQAFAQTVGKTGTTVGTSGDAATSVNSGANGGLSAPLAIPTQSLGLNGALSLSAAPTLNAGISPALAVPAAAVFAAPAALSGPRLAPAAAIESKPVNALVPSALQPASTPKGPASAASKQVEALSQSAKPVLEGVKNGDASGALHAVYEKSSKRSELDGVRARAGMSALRSGLKKGAPSTEHKAGAEVPAAATPAAKPGLWQRLKSDIFVYLGGLRWVKQQLSNPTQIVLKSPEGNEAKMLARLNDSLRMNGLPPYKTRIDTQVWDENMPATVILSPSSTHKVAEAREGGRQSPGTVHLVLDASWLPQEIYPDGRTKFLIRKAVVFDEVGQATVVEYEHPRRGRYFKNFFTIGANNRDDGHPFEANLDMEQGNSLFLETKTNDKLITRRLMTTRGIEVPETLASVMPDHELRESLGTTGTGRSRLKIGQMSTVDERESRRLNEPVEAFIHAVKFPMVTDTDGKEKEKIAFRVSAAGPGFAGRDLAKTVTNRSFPLFSRVFELATDPAATKDDEIVLEAIDPLPGSPTSVRVKIGDAPWLGGKDTPLRSSLNAFLDGFDREEVVVKPSGPAFHSGYGVRFFKKGLRNEIYGHALALAGNPFMTQDGVVMTDSRVESAPLYRAGRKMETTLRVLAARTPWDGFETADVFARVGPYGSPTTAEALDPRDNATVEPWQALLDEWRAAGYLDAKSERELDAAVKALGPTAFAAIAANEAKLTPPPGGGLRAQTDLIGLDVMIEKRVASNGKVTLVPVVIEVNDHDSGGQFNLDQMHPERSGQHSRMVVANAIQRARRDALRGKRILLVGAGYEGKRPIFVRAKELGVKVVLAGPRSAFVDSLLKDKLVDEYIETDNTKVKEARDSIRKKLQRSARKNGKLDGLTTFWEDDVELTALIAEDLKLPYHSAEASRTARSKFETQEVLAKKGVAAARQQRIGNLSTANTDKERDAMVAAFRKSASQVGFPAVIKPVSGAAAIGTEKVSSLEEAVAAYKRISGIINPKTDPIFANNSDLLLMQYLDGHEYDVDLVMVDGKPVFQSLTDNKPTAEPSFLATGSRLPSTLSAKQQKEAIDQAIASAQALGLTDGVIHMEGKYTSEGARLIEGNARMGGTYVHEWVKSVWGVDLAEEGFMAAARIGGKPFMPAKPLVHLDGDFVNSDKAGVIKVLELPEEARKLPGFIRFRMVKKPGDRITTDEGGGFARVAMIEVGGKDAAEAKRNLAAIKAKVRFVVE